MKELLKEAISRHTESKAPASIKFVKQESTIPSSQKVTAVPQDSFELDSPASRKQLQSIF